MKERKLNRLKGHDYSQSGFYFVTICTGDGIEHFGKIEGAKLILNQYGEIAERHWREIPTIIMMLKLKNLLLFRVYGQEYNNKR